MRRTGGQYFVAARTPRGQAAVSRLYGRVQSAVAPLAAGRGGAERGLASLGPAPVATCSISWRMAIIALQNRSSSARSSDSVGAIISVPATGKLMVGAWKP